MTRIAIDVRFAATTSGLGRYTRELVSHLLKRTDDVEYVLLAHHNDPWASSLPRGNNREVRTVNVPHYSFAEQRVMPRVLDDSRVDLLFSPHFNVPYRCPVPFVAVIHDLILHRYPNAAPVWKRAAYRFLMRRTVQRARSLICVSRFVHDEVTGVYGRDTDRRIAVIHEGVSDEFIPASSQDQQRVRRTHGLPDAYFLYVGNAKEHKNVPLLLEAFSRAGSGVPPLVLVCGGRESARLRLPRGAVVLPLVEDRDLPALYSGARAFVTASAYEGFCLPVAEALSCGCPVIAPDAGPFPDVCQGQAMLIEPTLAKLTEALRNPPPPPAGFRRPSWDDAAEKTAKILLGAA